MTEEITIDSKSSVVDAQRIIAELQQEHGYVSLKVTTGKQRTGQQRKAIEVYCNLLAKTLTDAGLDQRKVMEAMSEGVDIPWTQTSVKDSLWRKIQIAILGKESTTKLDRVEVSRVYDVLNRWTSDTFGISVEFPQEKEK